VPRGRRQRRYGATSGAARRVRIKDGVIKSGGRARHGMNPTRMKGRRKVNYKRRMRVVKSQNRRGKKSSAGRYAVEAVTRDSKGVAWQQNGAYKVRRYSSKNGSGGGNAEGSAAKGA